MCAATLVHEVDHRARPGTQEPYLGNSGRCAVPPPQSCPMFVGHCCRTGPLECQQCAHVHAECLAWSNLQVASLYPNDVLVHVCTNVSTSSKKPATSLQQRLLPPPGLTLTLLLSILLLYKVLPAQPQLTWALACRLALIPLSIQSLLCMVLSYFYSTTVGPS